MGSYENSPIQALSSAVQMVKAGRVHGIKLEGGASYAPTIRHITNAGIPVLAHIGLTPQRQHALGGFRVQGKTSTAAMAVLKDALAVQDAGAFAMVLEAVPAEVAALITKKVRIPTISIGAGAGCSGQVLVQADMVGNYPPGRSLPKFVKKFGDVWGEAEKAVKAYHDEVKRGVFPASEHTYPMPEKEFEEFRRLVDKVDLVDTGSLVGPHS
jgi:3-methyl-2-oxobutanoate hydroxymethyltransferase